VSVAIRTYEVSSRFSIAESRTQRLKTGEVYGVVKTKVFEASLANLIENRRAKSFSEPTISTFSGMPATVSSTRDGREDGFELIPTVGESGVLLSLRGLTNKEETFAIRLSLKEDESVAIVWKSGRQTMLTFATCKIISG